MNNSFTATALRYYGAKGWLALGAFAFVVFVLVPVLALAVPDTSPFHISAYWVTLAGKIILTFNVTDRGVLTDGAAAGVDDTLEQCVEGLMKTWSFTPVVDSDGDPTDVDLRLPLQLTPT